jgi:L-rhamnose mutarotase
MGGFLCDSERGEGEGAMYCCCYCSKREYIIKDQSDRVLLQFVFVRAGDNMSIKRLAYELHKPKRKHFPTWSVVMKGPHETYQADLVDMGNLVKWNTNVRYLLTVIDIFTKMGYAEPVKQKTGEEVTAAFEKILNRSGHIPKNLQTDAGKEFFNTKFQALMKRHGIHHYHTYSDKKASIVERWNRTLKTRMYRYFTQHNTLRWTKMVQSLVDQYNHSHHRSIGMKPVQVTRKNAPKVRQNIQRSRQRLPALKRTSRFQEGDLVRVSRVKGTFAKGYLPNWTEELFKVKEVMTTRPRTYTLMDLLDVPIRGTFYKEELQKTMIPDYARIEKVIGKKTTPGGQKLIRVKWKGYDTRFNQWIPASDAEKL